MLWSIIQGLLVSWALVRLSKWLYHRLTSTLPPGPLPLPLIGNLHLLSKSRQIHLTLTQISKKYGDIITIFMGPNPWIILNSNEALKETFAKNGHVFSGRPRNGIMRFRAGTGIGFSEGQMWKEQRTFTLLQLRELGFGKTSFEDEIRHELGFLVEALEKLDGQVINMRQLVECAISNVMCQILFGKRYPYGDKVYQEARDQFSQALAKMSTAMVIVDLLPIARHFPGDPLHIQDIQAKMVHFRAFITGHIDDHLATLSPDNVRDFTDAYLLQMKADEENGVNSFFNKEQAVSVCTDLFAGGFETTTNTLLFGFLHLILNRQIQHTLRQEIDSVIGDKTPSLDYLKDMPYVEATMHEMLRLGNPLPLAVPHRVTQDVKVRDYTIPAGSTVLANLTAISVDENVFKNPEKFDPEHFLKDGKFVKPETFTPFGIGRRMCVGDTVAKMELFLFLTSLVQRFHFSLPRDKPLPSTERKLGFTCCPLPYELCVTTRNQSPSKRG